MRNRAFAIFSCLRLYEEQCIGHLRILENLEDRMPKYSVGVTFAPLLVHRYLPTFGVRCELFGCQPKFNPSTLRKQTFQLADNVAEVSPPPPPVRRVSFKAVTEAGSRHPHAQRSRHVCTHGGLCAGLNQRAWPLLLPQQEHLDTYPRRRLATAPPRSDDSILSTNTRRSLSWPSPTPTYASQLVLAFEDTGGNPNKNSPRQCNN
jgi:hypothetical protein